MHSAQCQAFCSASEPPVLSPCTDKHSVQALWWKDGIQAPVRRRNAGLSALSLLWSCACAGGWPSEQVLLPG